MDSERFQYPYATMIQTANQYGKRSVNGPEAECPSQHHVLGALSAADQSQSTAHAQRGQEDSDCTKDLFQQRTTPQVAAGNWTHGNIWKSSNALLNSTGVKEEIKMEIKEKS